MFTLSNDLSTEVAGLAIFIKITVLLISSWIVYYLIPSHRSQWRVAAWRVFAVGILCLPLLTLVIPKYNVSLVTWQDDAAMQEFSAQPELQPINRTSDVNVPIATQSTQRQPQFNESSTHSTVAADKVAQTKSGNLLWIFEDWITAILCVWFLGTLFFTVRILRHQFNIVQEIAISDLAEPDIQDLCKQTARSIGCWDGIQVRVSPQTNVPYIYGCFNPVIILPERMAAPDYKSDLSSVFAHELSHIKNHDLFWMACFRFLQSFLWIHPLVWGIRSAHERCCEYASDERAAAVLGDAEGYAGSLAKIALDISGRAYATLNAAPMVRSSKIASRLKRVTNGIPHFPLSMELIACFVLLWVFLVSSVSAIDVAYEKSDDTSVQLASVTSEPSEGAVEKEENVPKNKPGIGIASQYIPSRDSSAGDELIDLSKFYNAGLRGTWQTLESVTPVRLRKLDNDLADLPEGLQTFDGVRFDIRGVVQLQGGAIQKEGAKYPETIEGIPIERKFEKLNVLHATSWQVNFGDCIGAYLLHYADGTTAEFKIVYGKHVLDWWKFKRERFEPKNTIVAWTGTNDLARPIVRSQRNATRARVEKFMLTVFGMNVDKQKSDIEANENPIRLFKTSWKNPYPDKTVESVDYVSKMTSCAPFLVAMTVE